MAKEYRKHCYVRQVLVIPIKDWPTISKAVYDQLNSWGWENIAKKSLAMSNGCYYDTLHPKDVQYNTSDAKIRQIDVIAGPITSEGAYKDTLCRPDIIGQTHDVYTSGNDLLFNSRTSFDEAAIKVQLKTEGYTNILRIGFSDEYFNERIR